MASDGSVTLDMSIDSEQLEKSIDELNATVEKFAESSVDSLSSVDDKMSELAKSAQKLKIEPTVDGLKEAEQNLDHLNAVIDNQENTLANYREAYKKASEEHGQFSNQALKLQKTILNLEDSINKNIKKSDEYAKVLGDIEDVLQEGGQAAQVFQKKMSGIDDVVGDAEKAAKSFSQQVEESAKSMKKAGESADAFGKNIGSASDTSDKKISGIGKHFKTLDQEMERLAKNAKALKIEPTVDGVAKAEKKLSDLTDTIKQQEKRLKQYREEYADASKGVNRFSEESKNLKTSIDKLSAELSKNQKTAKQYSKTIDGIKGVMDEGGDAANVFAEKIKKFGASLDKLPKSSKNAAEGHKTHEVALGNLIANGIQKAISAIGDLLEKTQEYRKDMSLLNQNAIDAGVSLEITSTAMRNLNAITGETDSNVEAVSNLLATGFKDNSLLEAVDALSGAVIKFPDTMKIESLADSLQETVATGEATGQFAELLGRLGVNVESYNKQIGRMTEAHRASYSIMVLNRQGMSEINEQYRKNNEALIATANAEYDYNQAMAELGEVLEPLKAGVLTQFTKLLTENRDTIQGVITVVGNFVEWLLKLLDAFLALPEPVQVIIGLMMVIVALILKFGLTSSTAFSLLAKGAASGTSALAKAGPAAMQAGTQFSLLALEIIGVAIAIALVVAAIASLIRALKGVPNEVNFQVSDIPDLNSLKKQAAGKGYATGTASAAAGYAWVGENGPELVKLGGGEEILTASQSMARRGINRNRQVVYNYSTYNTFKVDDIRTYQQIEQRMKNERITRRMGYTGV